LIADTPFAGFRHFAAFIFYIATGSMPAFISSYFARYHFDSSLYTIIVFAFFFATPSFATTPRCRMATPP